MESPMKEHQTAAKPTAENKNRVNRLTYLFSSLAALIPVLIGVAIDMSLGYENAAAFDFEKYGFSPVATVAIIAAFAYTMYVGIKRLHDVDLSGWWILLSFVPFVSIGLTVGLLIYPGTAGPNSYGPQPTRRYVYLFR